MPELIDVIGFLLIVTIWFVIVRIALAKELWTALVKWINKLIKKD